MKNSIQRLTKHNIEVGGHVTGQTGLVRRIINIEDKSQIIWRDWASYGRCSIAHLITWSIHYIPASYQCLPLEDFHCTTKKELMWRAKTGPKTTSICNYILNSKDVTKSHELIIYAKNNKDSIDYCDTYSGATEKTFRSKSIDSSLSRMRKEVPDDAVVFISDQLPE